MEKLELSNLNVIIGANGAGKSTIAACVSSVFFNMPMKEYFGKTENDSKISFEMGTSTRVWQKNSNNVWEKHSGGPNMYIKGFFEGSLIFGNRFKDMNYENLTRLDSINQNKLIVADEFIRNNLGLILQGDKDYYEKLWMVSNHYGQFKGNIFYYENQIIDLNLF